MSRALWMFTTLLIASSQALTVDAPAADPAPAAPLPNADRWGDEPPDSCLDRPTRDGRDAGRPAALRGLTPRAGHPPSTASAPAASPLTPSSIRAYRGSSVSPRL